MFLNKINSCWPKLNELETYKIIKKKCIQNLWLVDENNKKKVSLQNI